MTPARTAPSRDTLLGLVGLALIIALSLGILCQAKASPPAQQHSLALVELA